MFWRVSKQSRSDLLCFLTLFVVSLFVYSDAFRFCFAFADDYEKIYRNNDPAYDLYLADGRLLYAAFLPVFTLVDSVCELWKIRLLTVLGLTLLSLLHYKAARSAGWSFLWAFVFAVATMCTIPHLLFVGWASLYLFPFAACLAFLGPLLLSQVGAWKGIHVVTAAILLLLATASYQPSVGFYWVAVAIVVLKEGMPFVWRLRRFVQFGMLFASVLAVYYLFYRFGMGVLQVHPSQRGAALVSDFSERVRAIRATALLDSFSPFSLQPQPILCLFVVLLCVVGVLLRARREGVSFVVVFAFFTVLFPLSYIPSLLAGVASFSFRTQAALHALVLFLLCLFVREIVYGLPMHKSRLVGGVCALVLVAALLTHTHKTFYFSMVRPLLLERELLSKEIGGQFKTCPTTVHVVRPGYEDALGLLRYDEFGAPSIVQHWGVEVVMPVYFKELLPDCGDVEFSSSWHTPLATQQSNVLQLQAAYRAKKFSKE